MCLAMHAAAKAYRRSDAVQSVPFHIGKQCSALLLYRSANFRGKSRFIAILVLGGSRRSFVCRNRGMWGQAMKEKDVSGSAEDVDVSGEPQRYRAPALEKGLDILELISRATQPLTTMAISQTLGRSVSELFRMIQVLEHRGFIVQAEAGGGYVATPKLFSLGMAQAPVQSILEVALPVMRRLSEDADQSCHLALRLGGDILIAARMESAGLIGFSVRLGYRRPIPNSSSGAVLYAFQPGDVQERWERQFDPPLTPSALAAFRARAGQARANGWDLHPSEVVPGIVDISVPVRRGDWAAAALTVPFVNKIPLLIDQSQVVTLLVDAAEHISQNLAANDVRI